MKQIILIFLLTIFFSMAVYSQKIESLYTDLTDKSCQEIKAHRDDGILYVGRCAGIGGYKLIMYQSEHRQLLNLLTPKSKELELVLNIGLGAAPSSLGNKVEWRIHREGKKLKPFALIVRLNIFDNLDNPDKAKSYLIVSKIMEKEVCVTDIIAPAEKNQNVKARQLADISAGKQCYLKLPK